MDEVFGHAANSPLGMKFRIFEEGAHLVVRQTPCFQAVPPQRFALSASISSHIPKHLIHIRMTLRTRLCRIPQQCRIDAGGLCQRGDAPKVFAGLRQS